MEKVFKKNISCQMVKTLGQIGFEFSFLSFYNEKELSIEEEENLYNQIINWFNKKKYNGDIIFDKNKDEQKFSYTIFCEEGIKLHGSLYDTSLEAKKEMIEDLICLYKLDKK